VGHSNRRVIVVGDSTVREIDRFCYSPGQIRNGKVPPSCQREDHPGTSGHEVEMPVLDWDGHSKMSHNTRLKSKRFILNHRLLERCSFVK